jgi:pimeloyl-ACP methyl ester carboxylesterase
MFVFRPFFTLLSLAILALAGWLLWSGFHGHWVLGSDGEVHRDRDAWRLTAAAVLLAWSLLGRSVVLRLLARPDRDPVRDERRQGLIVESASGARLHVERDGDEQAIPLILTHGWSLDSSIWYYARRDLARRFQVITWDLPGLGRSKTPPDGRISLPDMARDLEAVLALAGRPAILVGHSIGGMTIQTLARADPSIFADKVAGVVLLNTTYTNPLETIILSPLFKALRWPVIEPMMRLRIWLQPLAWLGAWQSYLSGSAHLAARLGFGRFVTRSQLDHIALLMTRNPPAVTAKGDLAMFRWDAGEGPEKIDVPTLVVGGSADIVTRPKASRRIASRIPSARLQVIEGVNHMGPVEGADLYNGLIAEFAERVGGQEAAKASRPALFDPESVGTSEAPVWTSVYRRDA